MSGVAAWCGLMACALLALFAWVWRTFREFSRVKGLSSEELAGVVMVIAVLLGVVALSVGLGLGLGFLAARAT